MEKLQLIIKWYSGLTKKGKSFVILGAAAVVFLIIEGLKSLTTTSPSLELAERWPASAWVNGTR